ncbi:hypothetical protein EZV62_000485 [Acer yangbiense]|uniref:SGNH hydrolase-type esterase domain-containing protein n=1 Tax=Acer yangbiense TaxID=1000413 RepID=A0A5C7IU33_9ROSI|nr:hypothetical protein EZV62_000485 [Acer yangbiense]
MATSFILIAWMILARAFFVFGDSLVDNGNSNYLATTARADSPPYGMDYPTHRPTGREQLGAESILPYLSPQLTGQKLLVGANFASAGIGILNDTGVQFVCNLSTSKNTRTESLVNKALILITVGGNDFVNNYYLVAFSARSRQYSLPDYVKFVRLYDLGARRVLVTGTGPLGCVPAELAQRSRNGECSAELSRAAALFNPQLEQMLRQLNSQFGSDVFVGANTQLMHNDFISNPKAYGALPFNDLVKSYKLQKQIKKQEKIM